MIISPSRTKTSKHLKENIKAECCTTVQAATETLLEKS